MRFVKLAQIDSVCYIQPAMIINPLITYLSSFVTEQRLQTMQQVLEQRTRYVTVVLEDIFQPHNAGAVLRSCDAFGIQDVHIIENRNSFHETPNVSLGSSKWLSLHRYNKQHHDTCHNSLCAAEQLRKSGYRLIATTPHENNTTLESFDIMSGPAAFIFGNELDGISDTLLKEADGYMRLSMYGFVESLNLSVCCALVLHHISRALRQCSGLQPHPPHHITPKPAKVPTANSEILNNQSQSQLYTKNYLELSNPEQFEASAADSTLPQSFKLTEQEKEQLLIEWLARDIPGGSLIIKRYHEGNFHQ